MRTLLRVLLILAVSAALVWFLEALSREREKRRDCEAGGGRWIKVRCIQLEEK